MTDGFERLLEKGRIGRLELQNRIVMPAMGTCLGDEDGGVSKRLVDYYTERAKGGAGLILVENTLVHSGEKYGLQLFHQLRINDDSYIPGYRRLTDSVHKHGASIGLEIGFAGAGIDPALLPGVQAITASPAALPGTSPPVMTREASIEEIRGLVDAFGEAASRAKRAGFDLIEIHCAHGYGIAGFQSPATNKRIDAYGRDFDGRMRFGLEVLARVRETVGSEFPVMCRISVDEFIPGGIDLEYGIRMARKYAEAGADAIDLSCGGLFTFDKTIQPMYYPRAFLERHAAEVKKAVRVPVIVAGSLSHPELAERVLREGRANFIAIGRGLIADPELPVKLAEGRQRDIRSCIRCCECVKYVLTHKPVSCSVNIEAGNEEEYRLKKAQRRKKVVVVGGGMAGMEAARVAALRGHAVTLLEKSEELGGNLVPASVPEFKQEFTWLLQWFSDQMRELGVRVEPGTGNSLKRIEELKPEVVIAATGANPVVPQIPGAGRAVTAVDVLLGKAKMGEEVVMVGGGLVGCDTALFLAESGRKVTILEMLSSIASDLTRLLPPRTGLINRLKEAGVKWLTEATVEEISDEGVFYRTKNLERKSLKADTVVLAVGLTPNDSSTADLKGMVTDVYAIGDCVTPRKLIDAIHEGSLIARRI